jgi:hypothetical protein
MSAAVSLYSLYDGRARLGSLEDRGSGRVCAITTSGRILGPFPSIKAAADALASASRDDESTRDGR